MPNPDGTLTDEELQAALGGQPFSIPGNAPPYDPTLDPNGNYFDASWYMNMTPEERQIWQILNESKAVRAQNQKTIDDALDEARGYDTYADQVATGADLERIGRIADATQGAGNIDAATLAGLAGSAGAANALDRDALTYMHQQKDASDRLGLDTLGYMHGATDQAGQKDAASLAALKSGAREAAGLDMANLDEYRRAIGAANAEDDATVGELEAANRRIREITPEGWGDNLESDAAGVTRDAEATDMQRRAGDVLLGSATGANDITSQAAQATPEGRALDIQRRATDRYDAASQGALDLDSAAAGAAADPGSIEAQQWALSEMRDRSDPTETAAERYMRQLARTQEERDRKAFLDTQLRDLRMRGMGGSGAEVTALMDSFTNTSQNRMLQDMAARAAAVDRAEANLGRAGALAGDIRGSSFDEDMARREATDNMSEANRQVLLGALERYNAAGDTQREQSFGESLSRGTAADAVAAANRDSREGAAGQYADLASGMRGQAYDENMGAATAGDAMAQFNRTQSTDYQQWLNEFQRAQQDAQWGRAIDTTGARTGATAAQADRAAGTFAAGADTVGTNYDRYAGAVDAERAATADQFDRQTKTADTALGLSNDSFARGEKVGGTAMDVAQSGYARDQGVAGATIGANQQDWERKMAGESEVEQATDDLTNRALGRGDRVMTAAGQKTNTFSGDSGPVQQGQMTSLGYDVNQAAQKALEDDGKFDITKPETWF